MAVREAYVWIIFVVCVLADGHGALIFTQEPGAKLYRQEGSNAVLTWDYKVDNRTAELKAIIWSVYNKTERKVVTLLAEFKNGDVQYSNYALSTYGSRLKKEGRATLVIKNITVEDSTDYTCTLRGETGPSVLSFVTLIVTATANFTSIMVASVGSGMTSSMGANVTSTPGQSFSSVATPVSLRLSAEKVQSQGLPLSTSVPVHQSLASGLSKSSPEVAASSVVSLNVSAARTGSPAMTATRIGTEPPIRPTTKPQLPTLNATATAVIRPTLNDGNLYPYGYWGNDDEFRLEDSPYYYGGHCLRINTDWTGFPFFSERHYKLYICRNGKIQLNYEWSWWWPQKFGVYTWLKNMAVIAPFWATTDTYYAFRANYSKVYYQVHKQTKESSAKVLSMASQHVRSYDKTKKFANFEATWVLVVTWKNLCPYVYYPYYYYYYNPKIPQLKCPWTNTFQAVIITNGFNTFLMYNYPYGGIQWVVPADPKYYSYWTNYYGLPVSGWNAGNNGRNFLNHKSSATFSMLKLDKKEGNTGSLGRYFWRIEDSDGEGAQEKCFSWAVHNENLNFNYLYNLHIKRSDSQMACPCTEWQAWLDWGRFSWDWRYSWPNWCYESRRSEFLSGSKSLWLTQRCCYSTQWEDWASLKLGPGGGHVKVSVIDNRSIREKAFYTDEEAYKYCCVDTLQCEVFYRYRPSDSCLLYKIPPIRVWFWGDPHIKTLDGGNYTFNGLGEYVMVDAQDGTFQLQARTKLAQGNTTTATIFSAGAAKEENTSTIEVRVKEGGGLDILIDRVTYDGYNDLTNRSVEIGRNLSLSKQEENCLNVAFPSTTSVKFCEKKEMLSFVVTPGDDFKNSTKGLLGTWNDNPNDDFTLHDGTVLPSSSTLRDIHFGFGVKWQINQSQSLFTYAHNESVDTFSHPDFEPMFADNITWHNDSLREKAEAECGDDQECLFDVASTKDLYVGMVTKDINIQLVNESNTLANFPPKITTASNLINATLHKTVELYITAVDNDTITFRVINKPVGAIVNQSGNVLHFSWRVSSSQKFNLSFVATDDKGASTNWSPTINMCACDHDGQCVPPEEGDKVNTDINFVYMGCACQGGYTGRFCDSDIDACEMNGQPCYAGVKCTDLPPPANTSGYTCGPCPSGYTGNGAQCADIDECQSNSSNNCEQICVNVPASFFCDCGDGYKLNADGRSCDDINECEPTNDCMQKCVNTIGSYNCSCDEFFKPDPTDWRMCEATNPCTSGHGCQHVCFQGSNNQATCTCYANYELESDEKTCRDINECDPEHPRNRCNQICENTPGSYKCSCQKGFELNKDGYQCEDINECLDEDLYTCTDEFQKCVNTRGSYKCECEQDLYFIDGKCKGLERNETYKPPLPEPRVPSKKEKEEAVQFSITRKNVFEWDFDKDKSFKEKMAFVTTDYCNDNRTRCALKDSRRKRRSPFSELYTADQVHLLPGYPRNSSGSLQIAFYVQQPLGLFIGNISVLPRNTLAVIIISHKSELETAIGANISDVETMFKPTTPITLATAVPVEPSSIDWKGIALVVGFVVVVIIFLLLFWRLKKGDNTEVKKELDDDPPGDQEGGIPMTSYNLGLEHGNDE